MSAPIVIGLGAWLGFLLWSLWRDWRERHPWPTSGEPCEDCAGDGWYEGAFGCFDCRTCGGTGRQPPPRGGKG